MDQNDDQEGIASNKEVNNVNAGPIDSNSDDLNLTTLILYEHKTMTATKNMVTMVIY